MESATIFVNLLQKRSKIGCLAKAMRSDKFGNDLQWLRNNTARANVKMADFRIPVMTWFEPDISPGGCQSGDPLLGREMMEEGRLRQGDRVASPGRRLAPAVKNEENQPAKRCHGELGQEFFERLTSHLGWSIEVEKIKNGWGDIGQHPEWWLSGKP